MLVIFTIFFILFITFLLFLICYNYKEYNFFNSSYSCNPENQQVHASDNIALRGKPCSWHKCSTDGEQKCYHLHKVLLFNHESIYQANSLLTPGMTPKTVKVICIKCFKACRTSEWFTARKCFLPGLDFKSSQMTLTCLFPLPPVTVIKPFQRALRNTQWWLLKLNCALEP